MMRKALLMLGVALLSVACNKDWIPSKDKGLEGQNVKKMAVGTASKLFVLNEGGMGSNNSTLDFLRFSDSTYVNGAFKKMNPDIAAGLGDVGNDIAVKGNEVWIVVNNSGLVEVISAIDESEIAAIPVPTPRYVAFDSKYAYVTSWAGAHATGSYDASGNYTVTDSSNPKGQVYRINMSSKKVEGTVEVGYQPEGIAYYNGKLYVANSGGISSQLPPSYSYDNTVSIIDAASFKVEQTVEVEVNLKNVYSSGDGVIYVTTLGNYWNVHTGLYYFYADNPTVVRKAGVNQQEPSGDLQVSCSCVCGDTVYCIGTADEFDWSASHTYYVWAFKIVDKSIDRGAIIKYPHELKGTPYGLALVDSPSTGGITYHYLVVGDAGDYFNPGTVSCFEFDFGSLQRIWSVTAGVCPGHFAIW
jgi:hypothetical protein